MQITMTPQLDYIIQSLYSLFYCLQCNSPTTEQGVGNFSDKTSVMFQYLGFKLSFWFEILQGTRKILEPNNDIFSTFSKVLLARLFNECCRFDLFLMSWLSQMLRMYFKDNVDQI